MSGIPKKRRSPPLSVRFSKVDRLRLEELAGTKPLGLYIRERVLDGHAEPRRTRLNRVRDADALGRLLGLLGQSRLASNVNQLAKAANIGSLPVTVETEADLREACASIREMRLLLLHGLGIQLPEAAQGCEPIADAFANSGGPIPECSFAQASGD